MTEQIKEINTFITPGVIQTEENIKILKEFVEENELGLHGVIFIPLAKEYYKDKVNEYGLKISNMTVSESRVEDGWILDFTEKNLYIGSILGINIIQEDCIIDRYVEKGIIPKDNAITELKKVNPFDVKTLTAGIKTILFARKI